MVSADAVVLARLANAPPAADDNESGAAGFSAVDPNTGMGTFEVVTAIKGEDLLEGVETIEVVFFGPPDSEQLFFITGFGTASPFDWTRPIPLSDRAAEYVRDLPVLPPKGPVRLKFFQQYLEDDDPLLRQDSYDEFAQAPYSELVELKQYMDHDQLVAWITDPDCGPSRRRLYLTMLSVCGSAGDVPMLEQMILSDFRDEKPVVEGLVQASLALGGPVTAPLVTESVRMNESRKKLGLDAMIACYLTLAGPDVLDKIDERFLRDQDAEYTHIYNALMALRFHGEAAHVIPRQRLLESVRLLLDHPDFADQVIPDLARWEDWEILDRLVNMFKEAESRSFIRQPVVTYLVVASEQAGEIGERATAALDELTQLDPEAVERARSLMAFGYLGRARSNNNRSNYTRDGSPFPEDQKSEDQQPEETDDQQEATVAGAAPTGSADDDVADIPDPASEQFDGGPTPPNHFAGSNVEIEADAAKATAVESTAGVVAQNTPDEDSASNGDANDGSTEATAADSSTATSLTDSAETPAPNLVLIIGIPLIGCALLMGLFWLILRSGTA